jgi:hypothetical protein
MRVPCANSTVGQKRVLSKGSSAPALYRWRRSVDRERAEWQLGVWSVVPSLCARVEPSRFHGQTLALESRVVFVRLASAA